MLSCTSAEHVQRYNERVEDKKRKHAAETLTVEDIEVILPKQKQIKLDAFTTAMPPLPSAAQPSAQVASSSSAQRPPVPAARLIGLNKAIYTKEAVDRLTVKWIVGDSLSLRTVESKRFRALAKLLNPKYRPLSRNQVTDKVLEFAKEVEDKVAAELKNAFSVNFAFDNWTSLANCNFIAISGHYITKEFKMVDRCLVLEPYEVGHSAEEMQRKLEELLVKYNLGHCSATLIDSTGDEDKSPDFTLDD